MANSGTERSKHGKKGRPPKSVYLKLGIWYDEKHGHIHLASRDKRFRIVLDGRARMRHGFLEAVRGRQRE